MERSGGQKTIFGRRAGVSYEQTLALLPPTFAFSKNARDEIDRETPKHSDSLKMKTPAKPTAPVRKLELPMRRATICYFQKRSPRRAEKPLDSSAPSLEKVMEELRLVKERCSKLEREVQQLRSEKKTTLTRETTPTLAPKHPGSSFLGFVRKMSDTRQRRKTNL